MGVSFHEREAVEVGGVAGKQARAVGIKDDRQQGRERGGERGGHVGYAGLSRKCEFQVTDSGDCSGMSEQFDTDYDIIFSFSIHRSMFVRAI